MSFTTKVSLCITAIASALSIQTAHAGGMSLQQAEQTAISFFTQNQFVNPALMQGFVTHRIVKTDETGEPVFYIFEMGPNGFVVVSALEAEDPILGYSTQSQGQIEMDEGNVAFHRWMDDYAQQLRDAQHRRDIVGYRDMPVSMSSGAASENSTYNRTIAPMVTTQWSQNGFYDDATPNQQLTGCVATALAQFLRYHAYPEQGVGQNTYQYPDQDQITVDYANAQYQWHQMPDQLTQSNQQVAQLMYHAGTAVNTKYGSQVSLAPMRYLPNALEKHFDYVTNGFEYVRDYLPEQWQNLILDELKQNRIVLLTGHSADQRIGHAWVVDGYDGQGYYHMNWGWGGRMNGYFRLTEPNPRPDYNFNQQMAMVRGAPAQDLQHIPFCQGNQYFTQDQGQITDGSQNWNYRVNSQCKFVIQPQSGAQQITLDFTEFNTEHGYDFVTVYDGNTQIGQWSGSSLPQRVTATSGQMTIQFETDEVVTKGGFQAQYYVR